VVIRCAYHFDKFVTAIVRQKSPIQALHFSSFFMADLLLFVMRWLLLISLLTS
jgi:hypothetical protein